MPINNASADNVRNTFIKNSGNLMDSAWYGALFTKMQYANENADLFRDYTEEQKAALGFCDNIGDDTVKSIRTEIVNTHIPDSNFSSYKDCIRELYRANTRAALENEALYRQVLNALPADEPDREAKANYLFGSAGLRDTSVDSYMESLQSQFSDRLLNAARDVFNGKTHKGDAKKATIGEALSKLGLSDAEMEAFIKKFDYESPDQPLYAHFVKLHPDMAVLPVSTIMTDANNYLISCLQQQAEEEASEQLDKEATPYEAELLTSWKKRIRRTDTEIKAENQRLEPWIKEKGDRLSRDLEKVHVASTMLNSRLMMEGNKSLNDVSANAPSRDVLNRQAAETSYIAKLIQGGSASELIDRLIAKGNEKLPGLECKTGEQFINEIRRGFRDDAFDKTSDDYPARQFADIFAARILSSSVRGSKASLDVAFNRDDLSAVSDQLMNNGQFRDFINETYIGDEDEGNAKLREATHKLYASRTHGGFIEDEFKQYLLKLPAGELENTPELARFMPTAEERIDELKRQVKNAPDDKDLQENAAAEIIAIRNACKVERGTGYGLSNRIPPAPEGKRLSEEARKLQRGKECRRLLRDEETRRDILARGHGGGMLENLRKRYGRQVDPDESELEAESVLRKNTIGGQAAELRAEARQLSEQLKSPNTKIQNEALARSREVLGEFMALIDKGRNGRDAEAPWKHVNAMVKSSTKDPSALKMMKTPGKATGMMDAIASGQADVFQKKLTQELNALKAANAPKTPVIQRPDRVAEAPQGPAAGRQ